MNPHLAKALVNEFCPEEGRLLDPFVGGGAVLVESLHLGRSGDGLDVNPLAALISKVKTTRVDGARLTAAYESILTAFPKTKPEPIDFPPTTRIDFWFKPYMIPQLTKLRALIDQIEEPEVRDVFRVALSTTVRDVSLTYRGEVRLRRLQGKDYEKFNPDVMRKFRERAEVAIRRVSSLPAAGRIRIHQGSALEMAFRDKTFDAIVCSPPYGDDRNGVGYFQFSKNMLFWLGWGEGEIKQSRSQFLGQRASDDPLPRSATLENALDQIKRNPIPSNPKAAREFVSFYRDYQRAIFQMVRVCSGPVAIVIGDRRLSQVFIDNAGATTELMRNAGYRLVHSRFRTIEKKRIPVMQPGGGQRDRSGGGLIDKEHTLVYASA
jgi:hypothetical protein